MEPNYLNFYLNDKIFFKKCRTLHPTKFAIQGPESVTERSTVWKSFFSDETAQSRQNGTQ